MQGWEWSVLGLVLFALELFTPGGFVLMFFGVGALVVGVLELLGWKPDFSVQALVFALVSVAGVLGFRGSLLRRFAASTATSVAAGIVGSFAEAQSAMGAGQSGQVSLHGTTWTAHNAGDVALAPGERCKVTALDGIALVVVPA
jgi:membrane protein implicated in regulation of membrane protease activity